MDSIRQQQVAKIIQQGVSDVFLHRGSELYGRAFVTITQIKMTPDLFIARVYLSVYNVEDKQAVVDGIQRNTLAIRGLVGRKIKNKVRRIPEFNFYLDDTLDEVFKIDNLFKKLKDDKEL